MMKKILIVFMTLCFMTGCQKTSTNQPIVTNAVVGQASGLEEQQDEIKVEEPPVDLPVVGNGNLIVIDAGHQARGNNEKEPIGPGASETKAKVTSGATGVVTGNLESAINLQVALKLQTKLTASGYEVIMVRTSQDVNISNRERAAIANENGAAVFIRLHCNSDDASSTKGTLTMAPSKSNPYCSQIAKRCQNLSKSVLNQLCRQTGSKNRGVMLSDTMSGINWCQVPVTIVEMGFLSNPEEDRLLNDEGYQDKIVTGIVLGINEYLGR